jgi:hypothetical protein
MPTKSQIINELRHIGAKFNPNDRKSVLEALLIELTAIKPPAPVEPEEDLQLGITEPVAQLDEIGPVETIEEDAIEPEDAELPEPQEPEDSTEPEPIPEVEPKASAEEVHPPDSSYLVRDYETLCIVFHGGRKMKMGSIISLTDDQAKTFEEGQIKLK